MRVFITGGTGYIGSAIVRELASAGHEVTALNRSPGKSAMLERLGARVHAGDLHDPSSYRDVAAEHEALVHAAMDHDADTAAGDATTVDALISAGGSGAPRCFVYTSGCWVVGDTGGELVDEEAPLNPAEIVAWRPAVEKRVLGASADRFATAVVRPGIVYGGSGSVTARLFATAEEEGAAAYVGPGDNHWSMVHRSDLARLYRTVVEEAGRGVFHGVDGHPVRVEDVAEAASEAVGTGGLTRSIPLEEARREIGAMADALCMDQRLAAHRSAELGWRAQLTSFPDHAEEAYRELKASRH